MERVRSEYIEELSMKKRSQLGCVGKLDLASSGPFSAWLHPAASTIEPTSPASPSLPDEKKARSRADDGVFRQSLVLTGLMWSVIVAGLAFTNADAGEASISGTDYRLSTEDEEFLDKVQRKAFDYFWDGFDPVTGLIGDKARGRRTSIANSGFGLSAYCIGVERGWVTRQEVYDRVLITLNSYFKDPDDENDLCVEGKYGLFYHFINVDTGRRHRRSEVSTIDSALLMAGILHVMTYFKGTEVEDLAEEIYKNAQWDKFTNRRGAITGGWKPPEENWENPEYKGFNEYSLVYLIGLGSPTHPLPESSWDAYSSGNGFEWI